MFSKTGISVMDKSNLPKSFWERLLVFIYFLNPFNLSQQGSNESKQTKVILFIYLHYRLSQSSRQMKNPLPSKLLHLPNLLEYLRPHPILLRTKQLLLIFKDQVLLPLQEVELIYWVLFSPISDLTLRIATPRINSSCGIVL